MIIKANLNWSKKSKINQKKKIQSKIIFPKQTATDRLSNNLTSSEQLITTDGIPDSTCTLSIKTLWVILPEDNQDKPPDRTRQSTYYFLFLFIKGLGEPEN